MVKRYLPPEVYADIITFRKKNILLDIDVHRLDLDNGIVMFVCGDGDRFFETFGYKAKLLTIGDMANDPRIHVLAVNGGAIRLIESQYDEGTPPLNREGSTFSTDMVQETKDSLCLKKMRQVALRVHFPCGKSKLCNISPSQSLRYLALAKRRIMMEIPDAKVVTYCDVDYCQFEDGKKRSYFAEVDELI